MKKKYSILAAFLVFSVLCASSVSAEAMGKRPEAENKYAKRPTLCPEDARMILEINGVRLGMRRSTMMIYMEDGTKIDNIVQDKPDFPCSQKFLRHVLGFASGKYRVFKAAEPPPKRNGTYGQFKKEIEAARKEGKVIRLDKGLQKTKHWNGIWDIYLLPQDKAPTKSGDPVAMLCDFTSVPKMHVNFNHCKVSYTTPDGFSIFYIVLQKKYPDNDLLKADQDARKRLKQMIEEGASASINEQGDQ